MCEYMGMCVSCLCGAGKGESEDLLKPDTLIKEDSTTMTSSDEPAEPQAPIVMVQGIQMYNYY